jgi:hypothetical protein
MRYRRAPSAILGCLAAMWAAMTLCPLRSPALFGAPQLLAAIQRVRRAVPAAVEVSTADIYSVLLNHMEILAAVDVVFVNYYPYWQGLRVEHAVAALHDRLQRITAATSGKTVVISETSWPSCGDTQDAALPSIEKARFYLINFVSCAGEEYPLPPIHSVSSNTLCPRDRLNLAVMF